jgi:hypothetical protein
LPGSIIQVIIATNHVTDLHVEIIDDHGEVIGRRAIRSHNNQVIELAIFEQHLATHAIVNFNRAVKRIAETHDGINALSVLGTVSTPAIVTNRFSGGHLLLAPFVELFPGAITVICLALSQPLLGNFRVPLHSLALEERAFIGIESQPAHAIQDCLDIVISGPLSIGILYAKHKLSAMMPGIQPAKKSSTDAAKMQDAGWAGCETRFYVHICGTLSSDFDGAKV